MATGSSSNPQPETRRSGGTLEEETGLLDFGRGHDSAADYLDAVLLGGEGGGGGDPANHGGRIIRDRRRGSGWRAESRIGSAAPMRVIFIRFLKSLA